MKLTAPRETALFSGAVNKSKFVRFCSATQKMLCNQSFVEFRSPYWCLFLHVFVSFLRCPKVWKSFTRPDQICDGYVLTLTAIPKMCIITIDNGHP